MNLSDQTTLEQGANGIRIRNEFYGINLTYEEAQRLKSWLNRRKLNKRPKTIMFEVFCKEGGHIYFRRFRPDTIPAEVIMKCHHCRRMTCQSIAHL